MEGCFTFQWGRFVFQMGGDSFLNGGGGGGVPHGGASILVKGGSKKIVRWGASLP